MRQLSLIIVSALSFALFGCHSNSGNPEKETIKDGSKAQSKFKFGCCSSDEADGQCGSKEGKVAQVSDNASEADDESIGIGSCRLNQAEMETREKNYKKDLYPHLQSIREISDGYAMKFEGKKKVIESIHEYVLGEWECCPFLAFQVEYEANHGPVWVKFKGGEQVKAMIRANYEKLLPEGTPYTP